MRTGCLVRALTLANAVPHRPAAHQSGMRGGGGRRVVICRADGVLPAGTVSDMRRQRLTKARLRVVDSGVRLFTLRN
jgi:hypothetical protein